MTDAVPLSVICGALLGLLAYAALRFAGREQRRRAGQWLRDGALRFLVSARSLGRALTPVIVPLLFVAAFASAYYSLWVQVAAGATAVFLCLYLWFSDGRIGLDRAQAGDWAQRVSHRPAMTAQRAAARVIPNALPAQLVRRVWIRRSVKVLGVVLALVAIAGVVEAFGTRWTIRLAAIGFLVLIAARLVGYATWWVRILVVVTIGLLGYRVAAFVGFAPGNGPVSEGWLFSLSFAIPLGLLVALLGLEAFLLHNKPPPDQTNWQQLLRTVGFATSFAVAGLLLFGMAAGHRVITEGTNAFRLAYDASPTVDAEPLRGATFKERLAWTYAPMLRLHHDEEFPPGSADDYRDHATTTEVACRRGQRPPCLQLSCPDCATPRPSSTNAADTSAAQGAKTETDWHDEGVVFYARVLEGDELASWPGVDLALLVQYWIFYDYDLWDAETALGTLTQKHDADWEFVAIGLKSATEPLFLALSAHCGGQLVPWNQRLAVLADVPVPESKAVRIVLPKGPIKQRRNPSATHPLVAVARGSHANYADDSRERPPDWGSCMKLPSKALGPLVYAASVRDETEPVDGTGELVQATDIRIVTRATAPFDLRGAWGTETIEFGQRTWSGRPGPRSPPLQTGSWDGLIRSLLCDPYWDRDSTFHDTVRHADCGD